MTGLLARDALDAGVQRVSLEDRAGNHPDAPSIFAVFQGQPGPRSPGSSAGARCPASPGAFSSTCCPSSPRPASAPATPANRPRRRSTPPAPRRLPSSPSDGAFLGALTRESVLEALLRAERGLKASSCSPIAWWRWARWPRAWPTSINNPLAYVTANVAHLAQALGEPRSAAAGARWGPRPAGGDPGRRSADRRDRGRPPGLRQGGSRERCAGRSPARPPVGNQHREAADPLPRAPHDRSPRRRHRPGRGGAHRTGVPEPAHQRCPRYPAGSRRQEPDRRAALPGGDLVHAIVADSGTGLTAEAREHLSRPSSPPRGRPRGRGSGSSSATESWPR